MTTVADLVTALHDIDAYKGKVCGECKFAVLFHNGSGAFRCRKRHWPYGMDDGCDDWQKRPERSVTIQQRPRRRARK